MTLIKWDDIKHTLSVNTVNFMTSIGGLGKATETGVPIMIILSWIDDSHCNCKTAAKQRAHCLCTFEHRRIQQAVALTEEKIKCVSRHRTRYPLDSGLRSDM